jgi:hypothetical protein
VTGLRGDARADPAGVLGLSLSAAKQATEPLPVTTTRWPAATEEGSSSSVVLADGATADTAVISSNNPDATLCTSQLNSSPRHRA